MSFLKTVGKIIAAPVVLPCKAVVATAKFTGKAVVFTGTVAGKVAYNAADTATFGAITAIIDTARKK